MNLEPVAAHSFTAVETKTCIGLGGLATSVPALLIPAKFPQTSFTKVIKYEPEIQFPQKTPICVPVFGKFSYQFSGPRNQQVT